MKKWKKPNITGVKLDRTESGECGCIANAPATSSGNPNTGNLHYCHRDNLWHQNSCPSLNEGHIQGAKCPTNGIHEWKGEPHHSKCCCGSQSS